MPPEKIYNAPLMGGSFSNFCSDVPLLDKGCVEYLSPEAVKKLLEEFYIYIWEYIEQEVADKSESVIAFLESKK